MNKKLLKISIVTFSILSSLFLCCISVGATGKFTTPNWSTSINAISKMEFFGTGDSGYKTVTGSYTGANYSQYSNRIYLTPKLPTTLTAIHSFSVTFTPSSNWANSFMNLNDPSLTLYAGFSRTKNLITEIQITLIDNAGHEISVKQVGEFVANMTNLPFIFNSVDLNTLNGVSSIRVSYSVGLMNYFDSGTEIFVQVNGTGSYDDSVEQITGGWTPDSQLPAGGGSVGDLENTENSIWESASGGTTSFNSFINGLPQIISKYGTGFAIILYMWDRFVSVSWVNSILTVSLTLGVCAFLFGLTSLISSRMRRGGKY